MNPLGRPCSGLPCWSTQYVVPVVGLVLSCGAVGSKSSVVATVNPVDGGSGGGDFFATGGWRSGAMVGTAGVVAAAGGS